MYQVFYFYNLKLIKKNIKCIIPPSFGITVQIGSKEKQCNH